MHSWQASYFNAIVRWRIRKQIWGKTDQAVAQRARHVLGLPVPIRVLLSLNARSVRITDGEVRGEWISPTKPDKGTILYIHGGGFISGSTITHRPITVALAALTGYGVYSLEYSLAPKYSFQKALDEAVQAYKWLPNWLHQQGLAKDPIALAGDSAGGGLVLSLLLKAQEKGLRPPACAVCFSPWTDLTVSGASIHSNSGRCHMFSPENLKTFAAVYLNGASPINKFASPLWADPKDFKKLPPLLLQVSSTELLLDDSVRLADKIKEYKGDDCLKIYNDVFQRWQKIHEVRGISRLEIYDDVFHCWQMLSYLLPEARIALALAGRFINVNG